MDFWTVASYAAWIISAAIFLWMLWDAFKVGQRFTRSCCRARAKASTNCWSMATG